MTLQDLGFDEWFRERAGQARAGLVPARVSAVDRERYLVLHPPLEIPAEAAGALLFGAESPVDLPAVGDWVMVDIVNQGTFAVAHAVLPRKSLIRRKTAGARIEYQPIAANLDIALLMQALDRDFNLRRLERYLVMVNQAGIAPVILLTKSDRVDPAEAAARVDEARARLGLQDVFACSPKSGRGTEAVQDILRPGVTGCLLGSSGVGKTTLLNRLIGEDRFAVREIREGDGKGRHATTRRQMATLPGGGQIIDTPGMRELGNFAVEDGLEQTFPEIIALAEKCRFRDCTHTGEPGCAVREAVAAGRLDEARLKNWAKLRRESAWLEMSYAEKRDKDRRLGKYYRSVLKEWKKGRR
jgi:ribosome biogenesis GTPase